MAMIAPLQPYALRGIIWYQGEDGGHKYEASFSALIAGWRKSWGLGDIPLELFKDKCMATMPNNSLKPKPLPDSA